jgi:hypothetical protein
MRKRRLLLGAGVLVLMGLAGGIVLLHILPPEPEVTAEAIERVQQGMMQDEVEHILGPPSNAMEIDMEDRFPDLWAEFSNLGSLWPPEVWIGDEAIVLIWFDDGRVVEKRLYPRHHPTRKTFLDRLRRRLPW